MIILTRSSERIFNPIPSQSENCNDNLKVSLICHDSESDHFLCTGNDRGNFLAGHFLPLKEATSLPFPISGN